MRAAASVSQQMSPLQSLSTRSPFCPLPIILNKHSADEMKGHRVSQLFFVIILLSITAALQCPITIHPPCFCTSTKYETLSVTCDKAASFSHVFQALNSQKRLLDSLIISNTPIEELPSNAFNGLKVKKIFLRNNGLLSISDDAFAGSIAETLEELEIRGNHLEQVPQTGLPKLAKLKMLSLLDNYITKIENNAFLSYQSRTTIEKLDLSANNLTIIEAQAFLGLENLQQLSLDKNRLTNIPSEALSNIPTLEELSLSVNQIENVNANSLLLPSLKSLSLEVNQIRQIHGEAFESVPQLTYLYLGNNLFSSINPTMFYFIRNLKVLSLSNNKDITEIKIDTFEYLPLLVRIEMSDCSLTQIAPQSFHKMPKIQVIILSRNQLTKIMASTFSALQELISIDLSSNVINYIEDFSFSQLPQLTHLDLSANRLESLPQHMLYDSLNNQQSQLVRQLYLYNNPWRCDEQLYWIRKWLRANGDVQTGPPGAEYARCWKPSNLSGLDIRQTDPVRADSASRSIIGEPMRKYVQHTTKAPYGVRLPPEYVPPEQPNTTHTNMLIVVMGIVFGVIALALILIIFACYGKPPASSKMPKSNQTPPSVDSAFSTALSDSAIFGDAFQRHRSATNSNVFLNRPRYWWF